MTLSSFERLTQRHRLKAELVAVSGLRVGAAGKSLDVTAPSLPVLRDARDRPFIPGSSFKGVLRSGLERLIAGLNHSRARACDPFRPEPTDGTFDICGRLWQPLSQGGQLEQGQPRAAQRQQISEPETPPIETILEASCTVCGLFGSPHLAARIMTHDLPLITEGVRPEVRDGVGIDRDLGTAADSCKYEVEVLPAGSRFQMELLLENTDTVQLAWILEILDRLDQGELRIGGMVQRGLGRVRVHGLSIELITAEEILDGQDYRTLDLIPTRKLSETALDGLLSTPPNLSSSIEGQPTEE